MTDKQSTSFDSELDLQDTNEAEELEAVTGDEAVSDETADLSFLEEDESDDSELEADTNQKDEARKKTLDGQIKSAESKLASGEKSLRDFPKYIQKELTKLGYELNDTIPHKFDEETIVNKAYQKLQEVNKFESIKSQIQSLDLDKDQAQALKNEFVLLRKKGLSKVDSLQTAIRLAGISQDHIQENQRVVKQSRIVLPPQGQSQTMRKKEFDPLKLDDDQFLAWTKKMDALKGGKLSRQSN